MNTEYYLLLNWVLYDAPRRLLSALDHFHSESEFLAGYLAFFKQSGVSDEALGVYQKRVKSFDSQAYQSMLSDHRVRVLTREMTAYPEVLTHLSDPPPLLYYKGDLDLLKTPALAVVGSRKVTDYGAQCTRFFTQALSAHFVIISGMASGVDTIAHEACMDAGGKTIAVVGTGLDRVYPVSNRGLFEAISQHGLVISEFPFGTEGRAYHFPQRNRIVSALARATLVCEAAKDSGSLITARLTAELGRDVFVVPGSIFSDQFSGNHALIKDGAQLVCTPQDILEDYAISSQPSLPFTAHSVQSVDVLSQLNDTEAQIWTSMQTEPASLDQMVDRTQLPVHFIMQSVSVFEMKGWIKRVGTHYHKCV